MFIIELCRYNYKHKQSHNASLDWNIFKLIIKKLTKTIYQSAEISLLVGVNHTIWCWEWYTGQNVALLHLLLFKKWLIRLVHGSGNQLPGTSRAGAGSARLGMIHRSECKHHQRLQPHSQCHQVQSVSLLYTAMAETLKDEDFNPNSLELFFTEPKDEPLLIRAQDCLTGELPKEEDTGSLTVDMFTTDILHLNSHR